MTLRRTAALSLAAALLLAGCGGPKAPPGPVINFSVLSAESQQSMEPLWKPFLDDMGKATGATVKPFFASNYTALIEAMRFGQVQAGRFSALPALEAVRRSGGEVVARTVDPEGLDSYTSVIIARKDGPLDAAQAAACGKRLTFGMGDAKSLSGTLAPLTYFFSPRGIDPDTCFKAVRSANHQANLFAVANGVLDLGTMNSVGLVFAARHTPEAVRKVKVIWTSPPLPESAFVLKSDMDPALKQKIRDFLLTYGKADGSEGERQRKVLAGINYSGFRAAANDYLRPVAAMQAQEALVEATRGGDPQAVAKAKAAFKAAATAPVAASASP